MNKLSILLIILSINFSHTQSKKELINTLIKSNSVQLDYYNMGNEFGTLLGKITEKELNELTNYKNPIIRTYAKVGLIEKGKGNIVSLLKDELVKNETILVFDADLGDKKTTSSIVYETFLIKKTLDTLNYFKNPDYFEIEKIVAKKKIFKKIDSTIIYSNCNLNDRILNRVFSKKYDKNHLPQIERLAFKLNISHAFFYLISNYEKEYKGKELEYYINVFPNAKFETKNEIMNLINYLVYLIDSENKTLYNIGIKRLKKEEWKNHEFEFFIQDLMNEKGIKI
ncbi:hypothetical protein JBL43_19700 [Aureibaculum sp. A20]|uniref:Uncharacterized protein n=1 Tax=Aureibaculum flavum TaxID=2795986 RepID=A0ABS0WX38_9FLAO|nr:hypothetical protein [Aureibaculum flavum]MBJ2176485.1 hypothetical protein [Aureibaculum flavum]